MEWIDVNDRLPDEGESVLVYEDGYGCVVCEFQAGFFYDQDYVPIETNNWQPLPPPPNNHL